MTPTFTAATALLLAAILPAQALAAPKRPLVLAVSEGTSGGIDAASAQKKYAPLAERLGRALGASVEVHYVREFSSLEQGMAEKRFDLVIARPSDYPARGLRDYKYQFVATAQPDGRCMLAVPAESALKSVKDLRGKTFVMPEQASYMTRFCRAELRTQGIDMDKEKVFYVREQGAIPFALENKIADVGGLGSYSGAYRQWKEKGHRILHESAPQPFMPVVASPELSAEDVTRARGVLLGLGGDEGGVAILKQLSVTGFVGSEEDRLRKLLNWLGV